MKGLTDFLASVKFFIVNNNLYLEGTTNRVPSEVIIISSPIIYLYRLHRTDFEKQKFDFPWIPIYIVVTTSGNVYNIISVSDETQLVNIQHFIQNIAFVDYVHQILQEYAVYT